MNHSILVCEVSVTPRSKWKDSSNYDVNPGQNGMGISEFLDKFENS